MIQYHKSPFGLNLVFRLSGSAVYRASILGLLSIVYLVLMRAFWTNDTGEVDDELIHPYTIGVVLAGTSFLLVFRLQAAYNRYWEAASAVHHMMSKWMDAVIHTAAYHMQSHRYDQIKPPSFFDYHDLNALFLTRARERTQFENNQSHEAKMLRKHDRAIKKSIERVSSAPAAMARSSPFLRTPSCRVVRSDSAGQQPLHDSEGHLLPFPLEGPPRLDGNWGSLFSCGNATYFDKHHPSKKPDDGFASNQGGRTPALFLQELAHLTSLMTGVALSTLRNDVEGAESPLDIYDPGSPWPEVDPEKGGGFRETTLQNLWQRFATFIGFGRSPEERTKYNAARPLPVLGGVSDAEIRFMQMARGAYAKTQLTWYWLSEFIIREHLAGSTGDVGPPIISRIIQFLGDGMIYYNHARKIMFIPFPFPHAQLSVLFVLLSCPIIAFLMDQFAVELWVASVLTFLGVTVLAGMHEVARELENPFRNVPNELPLVTLQAQFNEALITMYAGYHPDHFWQDEADEFSRPSPPVFPSRSRSSPTEKKMDNPSSAPNENNRNTTSPSSSTSAAQHLKMEDKMQQLIDKLEQQSVQLEKQSLELDSLRSLVKERDKKESEPNANEHDITNSNSEDRKDK